MEEDLIPEEIIPIESDLMGLVGDSLYLIMSDPDIMIFFSSFVLVITLLSSVIFSINHVRGEK